MLYTQRIFWTRFNTEEKLRDLFEFLKKHRALSAEISFFTEGDGNDWRYVPPDEIERRAAHLAKAVAAAWENGFIPVINILNTLGHSDDGGPEAPMVPWQGMVGSDGAECRQCSCPADEKFLDYVRFKYEQFARCGAARYWIDDDLRFNNHKPVEWGCFCPGCAADFSKMAGRTLDRVSLAQELRTDRGLRALWIRRNARVKLQLLSACAEGIRRGHPGAELGLMICDVAHLIDTGADLPGWFDAMGKMVGGRVWLRPGGGHWSDDTPRAMLGKLHGVANSVDQLPDGAGATYELENYPFTLGTKSAASSGLECLLAILTTRLDGIMFDMIGADLKAHDRWTGDLARWVSLWNRAAEVIAGTLPAGWRPVYSESHFQQHVEERDPAQMTWPDYQKPCELQKAGVPLTGFAAEAVGHLLGAEASRGMSEAELRSLLDKPLIMDAEAARRFLDLGLGEKIGLRGMSIREEGAFEVFTPHPINGWTEGYNRVATMKYFGLVSYALEPKEGVTSLSSLTNYRGEFIGSALTLYQPTGGAPVAVLGHMPWAHVLSPQRMTQMRQLAAVMTLDADIPVIASCDRAVAFWYRRGANGKRLAVLFNPGFDDVTVALGGADSLAIELGTPGVGLKSGREVHLPGWSCGVLSWEKKSQA